MDDAAFMARALALAARGLGLTSPNPAVGAVLVRDGRVVGEGAHLRAGGPHAEVAALAEAGEAARGAACYVTLEPCCHQGRTPPCVEALIAAGVARIVAACRDPNPRVDGRGLAALRAAGIEVTLGVGEAEARALNRAFFSFVTTGRPHVTLKTAMTLDGKIAAWDGTSRWISGEAARAEAHRLRFLADAVLVGIGTVLKDDPALTVRLPDAPPKQPFRVVVDSRLRIRPDARVLTAGDPSRTIVAGAAPLPGRRAAALRARGVRVLELPRDGRRVSLGALLAALAELDVVAVLAEGGAELGAGLLDAGLVDRVAFFVAPRLLGGRAAPGPVGGVGRAMKEALSVTGLSYRMIGEDLLIEGDVSR
ncbi:MAG TPA: bifunctional diaminohydroxyphosphoribosylaminopyrimidine deaminase/5-amino-6-(5-phosphoribosylamino)uracil reductase RibD [Methylomirabilota bacterium]|nr:bifunctional diaminohydroxyphosphoribosylaminopyrimidine deaminase/5-amino-6-(5-phosphoribosylamino)uracil reductase RibD [Methylomirabilota bacterium]